MERLGLGNDLLFGIGDGGVHGGRVFRETNSSTTRRQASQHPAPGPHRPPVGGPPFCGVHVKHFRPAGHRCWSAPAAEWTRTCTSKPAHA